MAEPAIIHNILLTYKKFLSNPALSALLIISLYLMAAFAAYQYQRAKSDTARLQHDLQVQTEKTKALEDERRLLEKTQVDQTVDVFKQLSFKESAAPEDSSKLQTALGLNSFAKYALNKGDLKTAEEKLDQSRHVLPTLESQYYLGVLSYLQGRNAEAVSSWKALSKRGPIPDDIWLYIALAEYKLGNIEEAKMYTQRYSPCRPR